ncbi:glutamyl-Q tRNA(Asp) synthetase [Rhodothalassium salexigens DSM 2132]|uniref:Glutamyl-Q tRNA(Asp) synthetase n=1 Tax=Rhodothalassium salexigens DSM 2132 TaxID=1188247 RepID=A0A4R2PQJ9_RHOSA|nr:tRNA glutamyl-Q(34) synthetase GluQRS [Rhodothalassium salexigens]MBB4210967.1 glutamyl-Q tRNA(Asp) synthetase [Rhodothalassium salexigens DSM 2132]MBK1638698.1 tRNA glutamyl-Q(34) synthetase GluQRS [Rhodothalassium salexigens DSM 2132]TCP36375.1 glutamyl-Q tRNA(Asp) synthetase [Rhodothalassium salexigens DSM 2132]
MITRFAPSPTGRLHLGHAYSALLAHDRARAAGGTFLLRIEDIDTGRCRPAFVEGIFDDLAWLGLSWPEPVWRQSARLAVYGDALEALKARELVYPCFCTRAEIAAEVARAASAPHGPEGALYPGTCRALGRAERAARLARGDAHAWRLDLGRARATLDGPLYWHDAEAGRVRATPEALGDVVLARKDVATSYHLSVTVDDAAQGVSHIVRGRDLFHATHVHRLLQALLDLPVPAYEHHPLILGDDGRRLAKRDRSMTLAALRDAGVAPGDIRARLGLAPPAGGAD